jgi:hypothetical protein
MQNNTSIYSRNAADTQNIRLIDADSSDIIGIGGAAVTRILMNSAADTTATYPAAELRVFKDDFGSSRYAMCAASGNVKTTLVPRIYT